jgi:hypothetical protein
MTETKPPPQPAVPPDPDRLTIGVREGDDVNLRSAEILSGPFATNAMALNRFARGSTGLVDLDKLVEVMTANAQRVKNGDMRDVEAILVSQATVLNSLFAELVRRSSVNFSGQYFDAGERYLKMAYKAQNQCRMTLETLSTIKNPPVVYAKQANIAHGPQQVNNGPASATRTEEHETAQNKLLGVPNEQPLDPGAAGAAGAGYPQMETVGKVHRSEERRGKG